jgi:Flp pilus assembly protein TadG
VTTPGARRPSLLRDERGLISSLVIQAALIFTLIGLVLYEGGQVLVAQVKAQDVASAAAQAGVDTYSRSRNPRRVEEAKTAALLAAGQKDPDTAVLDVVVGQDGSVTVTTEKTALTLVIDRLSFLRPFGVRHATVREGPLPP